MRKEKRRKQIAKQPHFVAIVPQNVARRKLLCLFPFFIMAVQPPTSKTSKTFDTKVLWHDVRDSSEKDWLKTLDTYSVAVLTNVLDAPTSRKHLETIVDWLCAHSDGLTRNSSTWLQKRLPYGPRVGMMQSIISHCPTVWHLREHVYPLFAKLWGTTDLITSLDGATVYPPVPARRGARDWPHVDQTLPEPAPGDSVENRKTARCFQGQVVLSNTTASFRCSPKSHTFLTKLLDLYAMKPSGSHWLRVKGDETMVTVKQWLKKVGGAWQIPIHVPAGSMILWRSNTIHSAQRVERAPTLKEQSTDPWAGWRCTVYICQRPRAHFTTRQLTTVRNATTQGRTTNHWGARTFPKKAGAGRFSSQVTKVDKLEALSLSPEVVAKEHTLTPVQRKLVGLDLPRSSHKRKRRVVVSGAKRCKTTTD